MAKIALHRQGFNADMVFGWDQWLLRKKKEIIIKIKINPNHWSVQYSIQNHLIFKSYLLLHIQINCHMHIPWSSTRWDRLCSDVLEEEVVKLGFWESWRLVGLFWVFPITWERAETIADMSCWDLAENTGNDKWSSPLSPSIHRMKGASSHVFDPLLIPLLIVSNNPFC